MPMFMRYQNLHDSYFNWRLATVLKTILLLSFPDNDKYFIYPISHGAIRVGIFVRLNPLFQLLTCILLEINTFYEIQNENMIIIKL